MGSKRRHYTLIILLVCWMCSFAFGGKEIDGEVTLNAATGVLTLAGSDAGEEDLTFDFNSVSDTITFGSSTGVTGLNWAGFNFSNMGDITMAGLLTNTLLATDVTGVFIDGATNDYTETTTNYILRLTRDITSSGLADVTSYGASTVFNNARVFAGTQQSGSVVLTTYSNFDDITISGAHSGTVSGGGAAFTENNYAKYNKLTRSGTLTVGAAAESTFNNYGSYDEIVDSIVWNQDAEVANINDYGSYNVITQSGAETQGTMNKTGYAIYGKATGTADGTSTLYGLYIDSVSGADTNWGIFDNSGADGVISGNLRVGSTAAPTVALDVTGAITITDGGLLSTGTTDGFTIPSGAGTRMMWIPSKTAFRAGIVTGSRWDSANIGEISVALGWNTAASGTYSASFNNNGIASGIAAACFNTDGTASGFSSAHFGSDGTASGVFSFHTGLNNLADAYAVMTLGRFSAATGAADPTTWADGEAIFVVGNGTSAGARATALTIFNDGTINSGAITSTGNITILNSTPILVFKDSDSLGAASVGFIEWRDAGGGRAGFLGNNTSGNDDLLWKNEQGGNIGIQTTGAGKFQIFANVELNDNSITGMGNITGSDVDIEAGTGDFNSTGTIGSGAITSTGLGTFEQLLVDGDSATALVVQADGAGTRTLCVDTLVNSVAIGGAEVASASTALLVSKLFINTQSTVRGLFGGVTSQKTTPGGILRGLDFGATWTPVGHAANRNYQNPAGAVSAIKLITGASETFDLSFNFARAYESSIVSQLGATPDGGSAVITKGAHYYAPDGVVTDGGTITELFAFYDVGQTVAGTNWSYYNAGGADSYFGLDGAKLFRGDDKDVSDEFTAGVWQFKLDEVGNNTLKIGDGANDTVFATDGLQTMAGTARV